ncbi:hypothetical protein F2Q69_00030040 [Brassica cretica]|uniref:Uncharacterized protein n=1 Tax=Brassica cretica TaxID=69181 RepID=A0A8S9S5S7_BRACR|nr:hypothetical protein F2Q69_00030040 [Brassica cretica]
MGVKVWIFFQCSGIQARERIRGLPLRYAATKFSVVLRYLLESKTLVAQRYAATKFSAADNDERLSAVDPVLSSLGFPTRIATALTSSIAVRPSLRLSRRNWNRN